MVYDDAEKYYAAIFKSCSHMLEQAFQALFPNSSSSLLDASSSSGGKIFGINTSRVARREVVEVELDAKKKDSALRASVAQVSKDGKKGWLIVDAKKGEGVAEVKGVFAETFEKGVTGEPSLLCCFFQRFCSHKTKGRNRRNACGS